MPYMERDSLDKLIEQVKQRQIAQQEKAQSEQTAQKNSSQAPAQNRPMTYEEKVLAERQLKK